MAPETRKPPIGSTILATFAAVPEKQMARPLQPEVGGAGATCIPIFCLHRQARPIIQETDPCETHFFNEPQLTGWPARLPRKGLSGRGPNEDYQVHTLERTCDNEPRVKLYNVDSTNHPTTGIDLSDADEYYLSALASFTASLERAIVSSQAATGLDAGEHRFWGSVLFTRLCATSVSILWLCPRSKVNPRGRHWDFGSIASLARNLYECALHFFYLAVEPVSDPEWFVRLKVIQLHDCMERLRLFRAFDPNDEQLAGFEAQADELKGLLQNNTYFSQLSEASKKTFLKGERSSILSQDEILQRMGKLDPRMRGYYRFFSSHAHSFPLSFYRMAEDDRGQGVENDVDKGYIAGTLEFCTDLLETSTDGFQKTFADISSFTPGRLNWDALMSAQLKREPISSE